MEKQLSTQLTNIVNVAGKSALNILNPQGADQGFNISRFRASMNKGVANPSLFTFQLLSLPKVIEDHQKLTKSGLSAASTLDKIASVTKNGLSLFNNFNSDPKISNNPLSNAAQLGSTLSTNSYDFSGKFIEDIQFKVNRVTLPDRSLETYPVKYYGIQYTKPRDIAPTTLTINVLCSETYIEHFFFAMWMAHCVKYGYSDANFDVSYFDDIVSQGVLKFFGSDGLDMYTINFENIYPIHVEKLNADWSKRDDFTTFAVTLAFTVASYDMPSENDPARQLKLAEKTLTNKINNGVGALRTSGLIDKIKVPSYIQDKAVSIIAKK